MDDHRRPNDSPNARGALDDPDYARFAWARFRNLMAWMTLAAAVCVGIVIATMAHVQGPLHLVTMLAIIGGVGGSVMLAAALMGLVFLSSGSGHDEDVDRGRVLKRARLGSIGSSTSIPSGWCSSTRPGARPT